MARNMTFGELVTMYREEAGHAANPVLGASETPRIKARLRRIYRFYHEDFDWPHLNVKRDETMQAGQRFYSLPPDLKFETVREMWSQESGYDTWYRVKYGISYRARSWRTPDDREDPVSKWEVYENSQFEVWPTPATNGNIVRIEGRSVPRDLVSETDRVNLDADLIVLFAVAEDLQSQGSPAASLYLDRAQRHYTSLKGRNTKAEPINMTSGVTDRGPRTTGIHVHVPDGQ